MSIKESNRSGMSSKLIVKTLFILSIFSVLILVPNVEAKTQEEKMADSFLTLDEMNAYLDKGVAIFTFKCQELECKIGKDLTSIFDVHKGSGIKSYEQYVGVEYIEQEPIYQEVPADPPCEPDDDVCARFVYEIIGYEDVTKVDWYQIKQNTKINSGIYKIKVIAYWKPMLGQRSIDWIPKLKMKKSDYPELDKDYEYKHSEWAFWDTSWLECTNVTITNNDENAHYDENLAFNITDITFSDIDEIRVTNQSCSDGETAIEIPRKIVSSGSDWAFISIVDEDGLAGNSSKTISVYSDNNGASTPEYDTPVTYFHNDFTDGNYSDWSSGSIAGSQYINTDGDTINWWCTSSGYCGIKTEEAFTFNRSAYNYTVNADIMLNADTSTWKSTMYSYSTTEQTVFGSFASNGWLYIRAGIQSPFYLPKQNANTWYDMKQVLNETGSLHFLINDGSVKYSDNNISSLDSNYDYIEMRYYLQTNASMYLDNFTVVSGNLYSVPSEIFITETIGPEINLTINDPQNITYLNSENITVNITLTDYDDVNTYLNGILENNYTNMIQINDIINPLETGTYNYTAIGTDDDKEIWFTIVNDTVTITVENPQTSYTDIQEVLVNLTISKISNVETFLNNVSQSVYNDTIIVNDTLGILSAGTYNFTVYAIDQYNNFNYSEITITVIEEGNITEFIVNFEFSDFDFNDVTNVSCIDGNTLQIETSILKCVGEVGTQQICYYDNQTRTKYCSNGCYEDMTEYGAGCSPTQFNIWILIAVITGGFMLIFGVAVKSRGRRR